MSFRSKEVVFWTIAWPIIWILMVAFVFMAPAKPVVLSVAIVDLDQGVSIENASALPPGFPVREFVETLINSLAEYTRREGIELKLRLLRNPDCAYPCADIAHELIENKTSDVVIVVPPNASECFSFWAPVRLAIFVKAERSAEQYLYLGPLYGVIANISVNTSLSRIDTTVKMVEQFYKNTSGFTLNASFSYIKLGLYGIAFPLVPEIEPVKPRAVIERGGALGYTVLGGIGYVVVLSSMTQAIGILVYRKETGLLKRLLASPLRFRELVAMDLISVLIFQLIASIVVVLVGIGIGARIPFNPLIPDHWGAIAAIILASLFAYLLGLALAPMARTARGASGLAVALSLLFIFTTGIWWPPKEMLPLPLRAFANIFPPALAFDAVRSILIWGRPLTSVARELGVAMIGTALLAFLVVLAYFRRFERIVLRVLGY